MPTQKLTLRNRLYRSIADWMLQDKGIPPTILRSDFKQLNQEIQPCDILLVEGSNRISRMISFLTRSPWTHVAMCIGRYQDIKNHQLQELIQRYYQGPFDEPLLIESYMSAGVCCVPLSKYELHHVRLCRPRGLHKPAIHKILHYVISQLGVGYDIRQIADLGRFFFPWGIFPRRWNSSLFKHHAGPPTRLTCSLLLVEAFSKVRYPVLPILQTSDDDTLELIQRHPRLYTPTDFDFSPFFDIIKYPLLDLSDPNIYQNIPWSKEGLIKE